MGAWAAAVDWFIALPPAVQAACITGSGTLAAAGLAAKMITVQLKGQADNALAQSRKTEQLKLKLEVYRQILKLCDDAGDGTSSLIAYLTRIDVQFFSARVMAARGLEQRPTVGVPELLALKTAQDDAPVKIIVLVESWQIVDPRMAVFQDAANALAFDIRNAFIEYNSHVMKLLPIDRSDGKGPLPWVPPSDADEAERKRRQAALEAPLYELNGVIGDLRTEMQNALLSELFDHTVPAREPADPQAKVIRLAEHAEIIRHLRNNTPWGVYSQKVIAEARARFRADDGGAGRSR